jgi:hypothetical protein
MSMKSISSSPITLCDAFLSADEVAFLLPQADMFLRCIMSGQSGIRIREGKLLIPLHMQWKNLKLVWPNFIAKPWREVIAPYITQAEKFGCELNEEMDERELLMSVADFYLAIKFPQAPQVDEQSDCPQTTQQKGIVREEVAETLDTSPYTNPDYLMRAFFPCMWLAVQPVDQTLEITKKILDFPKRMNVWLMKDFLRYFSQRQNKIYESVRGQEQLAIKTIEYLLLHLKLHLGRPLIIASSLLHGTESYAPMLRSLQQAGIISIKPNIFAELAEMMPSIPEKWSSSVRTSKLSSEHHRRIFDESLLQEMWYRNAKSLHPQMMIALWRDEPMTVMDIANALHALSDAQHYELKKSHPIIFHTFQKLFEHILLEINPHYTRKRFLIKSTR